jgi:hypothetical protein
MNRAYWQKALRDAEAATSLTAVRTATKKLQRTPRPELKELEAETAEKPKCKP